MSDLDLLSELKEVLAQRLGTDASSIDPHAELPEVGLDSVAALELLQVIEDRYGVEVPSSELFASEQTLEQVAALLASSLNRSASDFLVVWDPDAISPELYGEFVEALGNLVRANGGAGIVRSRNQPIAVNSSVGVPA